MLWRQTPLAIVCIWVYLFAFNFYCYRMVWWLFPALRTDVSHCLSLSGVTWFSMGFYINASTSWVVYYICWCISLVWQVAPPKIQPEAVGAASICCHPSETKWFVASKPGGLELLLNLHIWERSSVLLGLFPFAESLRWVRGQDSNNKHKARQSLSILVLPLLPSEINMFPSQGTCKLFRLSFTFGWSPNAHIHDRLFLEYLNEPERLCLL